MARTPRTPKKATTRRPRRLTEQAQPEEVNVDQEFRDPTADELIGITYTLRAQVEACRAAFFRLATVRAADMVVHQAKSWDDGAAYINAEMQALDAAIANVAQNGAAS